MLLVAEYFCFAGLFIRKNIILIKKKSSRVQTVCFHFKNNQNLGKIDNEFKNN